MCSDHDHGDVRRLEPEIPAETWRGEMLELEPVDEVVIVSVCDNTIDLLLADEGPARRLPLGGEPIRVAPAPTLIEGKVEDAPIAQHGFSVLVMVRKDDEVHQILFDTGISPEGCVESMARLDH